MRAGWAAEAPILHLDATLRPELVQPYLPLIDIGAAVAARQPHVRIRQVTGSPTSARALTPGPDAPERVRKAACVTSAPESRCARASTTAPPPGSICW